MEHTGRLAPNIIGDLVMQNVKVNIRSSGKDMIRVMKDNYGINIVTGKHIDLLNLLEIRYSTVMTSPTIIFDGTV
ncbi:hypothetical protein ACS0TY_007442 [Phlomoides rotata]